MKHEQVFVRAINKNGKYEPVDVLKLDDASFRAFVIDILFRSGLVAGIVEDRVEGESIEYKEERKF